MTPHQHQQRIVPSILKEVDRKVIEVPWQPIIGAGGGSFVGNVNPPTSGTILERSHK